MSKRFKLPSGAKLAWSRKAGKRWFTRRFALPSTKNWHGTFRDMRDAAMTGLEDTFSHLTSHSTLSDLPAHEFHVQKDTPGQMVAVQFEQQSELPGVLIRDGEELLGIISREAFLEHMSRPFALELYMRRPITALLNAIHIEPLTLPADCPIHEAAHVALARPREHVYEPIIIGSGTRQVRLLSIYTLLLAQSKQLEIANESVRRQKAIADAANQAKSQFLSTMSHEIRTPMNGVIGMTDLVLRTQLTDQQREYLDMVKNSAEWLLSVINDVLDFSKIEAGKLEIENINFRVRDMLADLVKPLEFRAAQKGLDLICSIAPDVPQVVNGDPNRLRQIVVNLVGNAIKFTETGQIEVRVERESGNQRNTHLRFAVSDTGIGIPKKRIQTIFAAFEQADGSTTRKFGGTGLGLAISKRLVELMDGWIWVESEEGIGSTFHFMARFEALPDDAEVVDVTEAHAPQASKQLPPLKILLAEDNVVNQTLAVKLLEEAGHTISVAADGKLAVGAYQREPFDLILMDVQMPIMDGFAATAKIRQLEQQQGKPRIPIIAMTAHAMKGDREKCFDAGMDGYVSKPIRVRALMEELEAVMPDRMEDKAKAAPPPVAAAAHSGVNNKPAPLGRAIDWDAALANMGGREELLREVAGVFLSEKPSMVEAIRQAIDAQDAANLQRAAHTIKGSIGYFSARKAYEAALELENIGRDERMSDARAGFERLLGEVERIEPELSAFYGGRPATAV